VNSPGPFGGIRVIENAYAMAPGKPRQVARMWRERWLSRPWRPWVRTRTETPMVPASYMLPNGTLVAHPEVIAELRRTFPQGTL
jgi:hypothetical protein